MSPDLAEALDRDMEVRRHFDSLSYSKKQRLVLPIEEAKKAETRQRRLDKAVSELREGRI
ncbi:MAG TPA: YdeI/OmpD-associated family protein [Rubrobacter sp.]|nr:YdeI/OmpD-associated family protein [Rubrobacter sp.]